MTITMSSAHSPTFPSLNLRHNSFSNPSVALPKLQLILQPFRCFTYFTVQSQTNLSLLLRHSSFPNFCRRFTYVTTHSPTLPSRFAYVTAHSPTIPLLHLCHSSFSYPSFASFTSQLILQSFRRFTYVTTHSPTLPSLYLRHSSFSNPSVASHTSQPILQPFFRFSCVTSSSLNSPGEPPMMSL